jgi:DNA polymerase-4
MILHLDADAFFASVEQAADARLRGRPIAVGGMKRGIVASASYEARKFGVYTPMPTSQALRLCPRLIVLPGDYDKYELFSRFMFSYAYDLTPEVEVSGIDEGYADLAGLRRVRPEEAAQKIQRAIAQQLKIGVSEGVAANKLVAQIASKLRKPRGFIVVESGREREFLDPLAVNWLPGVGPKLAAEMRLGGLTCIRQVAQMEMECLRLLCGVQAAQMLRFSQGIDDRPVVATREAAKSYSHQETFATDTCDEEFLTARLCVLADDLVEKMRCDRKCARTVSVKIRYADMSEAERSESLPEPADLPEDFYGSIRRLFRAAWDRRVRLRLVRVKFSNLYSGPPLPTLFNRESLARRNALQDTLTAVRNRFGSRALMRSHDWLCRRDPTGRSRQA